MPANNYLRAAAFMLPFLAAAPLVTPPAHAQRPALVKNIDEKGRTPYQKTLGCSAAFGYCLSTFPPVPANKRLVVENVNAFLNAYANATPFLTLTSSINTDITVYFPTLLAVPDSYVFIANSSTLTYFEAGDSPKVFCTGVSSGPVTLSGYLVDLAQ